jgi:hypothetical protein
MSFPARISNNFYKTHTRCDEFLFYSQFYIYFIIPLSLFVSVCRPARGNFFCVVWEESDGKTFLYLAKNENYTWYSSSSSIILSFLILCQLCLERATEGNLHTAVAVSSSTHTLAHERRCHYDDKKRDWISFVAPKLFVFCRLSVQFMLFHCTRLVTREEACCVCLHSVSVSRLYF